MPKSVTGFSKLSKSKKIDWIVDTYFSNSSIVAKQTLEQYWNSNQKLQQLHDEFIENTITNYYLPLGVAPNFLINGKNYTIPMAIEESSVVAAASKSAKFWLHRGGFKTNVISTTKIGQVHLMYSGDFKDLKTYFTHIKSQLLTDTNVISRNMEQRGGGILDIELIDKTTDIPDDQTLNINYLAVGANNPTFAFDNGISRCTFTNLHIPKILGADDMPSKDGDLVTSTIGNFAVKIGDNKIKNKYLFAMLDKYDSSGGDGNGTIDGDGETINYLLNYSVSGISIHSLFGESQEQDNPDLDDMLEYTSDNWFGCLLSKLGFEYEDLIPRFGVPHVMYDESIVSSTDPTFRYKRLKDLTTNPLIDISIYD